MSGRKSIRDCRPIFPEADNPSHTPTVCPSAQPSCVYYLRFSPSQLPYQIPENIPNSKHVLLFDNSFIWQGSFSNTFFSRSHFPPEREATPTSRATATTRSRSGFVATRIRSILISSRKDTQCWLWRRNEGCKSCAHHTRGQPHNSSQANSADICGFPGHER